MSMTSLGMFDNWAEAAPSNTKMKSKAIMIAVDALIRPGARSASPKL
jgi:hypothetical protein